jgi:hypothetical protein
VRSNEPVGTKLAKVNTSSQKLDGCARVEDLHDLTPLAPPFVERGNDFLASDVGLDLRPEIADDALVVGQCVAPMRARSSSSRRRYWLNDRPRSAACRLRAA